MGVQCQDQIFDSCKISPNGVDQKNQFPARQLNEVKISPDEEKKISTSYQAKRLIYIWELLTSAPGPLFKTFKW